MHLPRRVVSFAVVVLLFFGFLAIAPANALAEDLQGLSLKGKASNKLVYKISLASRDKYQTDQYRIASPSYFIIKNSIPRNFYYYPTRKIIRIYFADRNPVVIREPQLQPVLQPQPLPGSQPQPVPRSQPQPEPKPDPVRELTADEQRMVELINQERDNSGLPALKVNLDLVKVARLKAQDMVRNNYFSHSSPTYGSPFAMMKQFGITYHTAGENLAGAPTVEIAHRNLMNSTGHRANILNRDFTEVGIGIVEGSAYGKIFVQMFIGK